MRLLRVVPAILALLVAGPASAQWIDYTSERDLFSVNFPGEPTISETTHESHYGSRFPARVYSREYQGARFSMTVVDHTDAERIFKERVKDCNPDAQTDCAEDYWLMEIHSAENHAAHAFLTRAAKVTYFGYSRIDRIGGHQIQLVEPNGYRTFVEIHMHEDRLYIQEASVPPGQPEPALFGQSLRILDKEGKVVRYETDYRNRHGVPPRAR
jgi:hypothetical protein